MKTAKSRKIVIYSEEVIVLSRTTPKSRTLEWKFKTGISKQEGEIEFNKLLAAWQVLDQIS